MTDTPTTFEPGKRFRVRETPEVEAMRCADDLGNHHAIATWITESGGWVSMPFADPWLIVRTAHGDERAGVGDWVVRHESGGLFSVWTPDEFSEKFEAVPDGE